MVIPCQQKVLTKVRHFVTWRGHFHLNCYAVGYQVDLKPIRALITGKLTVTISIHRAQSKQNSGTSIYGI